MKITDHTRAVILDAMRRKQMEKQELAKALGVSNAWVTKLFSGKLVNLTTDRVIDIESVLDIRLVRITSPGKAVHSQIAEEIARLIDNNPTLTRIAAAAVESLEKTPKNVFTPPYLTTKQLRRFGHEATRIVFANEGHPGAIGRQILELLANTKVKK